MKREEEEDTVTVPALEPWDDPEHPCAPLEPPTKCKPRKETAVEKLPKQLRTDLRTVFDGKMEPNDTRMQRHDPTLVS